MAVEPRLLVVEDEGPMRELVVEELSLRGLPAAGAASLAAARAAIAEREFDAVLLDLRLPDGDGMDLLREIRAEPGGPEVVISTGHGSVSSAVEAMRAGAFHYAVKPFVLDEVEMVLRRALERVSLDRRARALERIAGGEYEMAGDSPAMAELRGMLGRVAAADSPVLVQGETGVGKEMVARTLHALGPRARGPFVPVNCGALQEGLLESEIFGHERGSFTGAVRSREGLVEVAHGGTLFLDEIGEMPPALQVKFLRLLQDGEVRRVGSNRVRRVDVRFVAATNRDLGEAVRAGRFREDLYYRIRVLPVAVPPLRERPGDVAVLAKHFLAALRRPGGPGDFSPRALAALAAYPWPGNVRELRNIVERMAVLAPPGVLDLDQVPAEIRVPGAGAAPAGGAAGGFPPDLPLAEVERLHILRVLDASGGNKTRAAEVLGVTVRTLYNRLDAWRREREGGAAPGDTA
ncbi:MAG: sigma-54 dependent transcriptional regulator [Planctomycetes bacterium]|nr:sigma-54 dependent transcriptional regulator [Planctomycetota bacterium]